MSDETPAPQAEAAAPQPATPAQNLLVGGDTKRYEARFIAIYAVLGLALVGAMATLVVLSTRPGAKAPLQWSSWQPKPASTAAMTKEIADHVASQYRLSAGGAQLVALVPSKPRMTSGTTPVLIQAVAIRKKPNNNASAEVFPADKAEMYTLCGLGLHCAITSGTGSATRGRLVQREALEVALYTFKYVPAIDSIIAFLPPPPGEVPSLAVYLQKANLKQELTVPLHATLTLANPPLPDEPNTTEAATIDKLASPATFKFSLSLLQTGGVALVLDPPTPAA